VPLCDECEPLDQARCAGQQGLCSATPEGFHFQRLPGVPPDLSPRQHYDEARQRGHFAHPVDYRSLTTYQFSYSVDVSRDFNGVGLLYFSTFFSIVDKTVSAVWEDLGRSYQEYFDRRVTAERVLFLGNADAGALLSLNATLRARPDQSGPEHLDIQVVERATGRLLAIADVLIDD